MSTRPIDPDKLHEVLQPVVDEFLPSFADLKVDRITLEGGAPSAGDPLGQRLRVILHAGELSHGITVTDYWSELGMRRTMNYLVVNRHALFRSLTA